MSIYHSSCWHLLNCCSQKNEAVPFCILQAILVLFLWSPLSPTPFSLKLLLLRFWVLAWSSSSFLFQFYSFCFFVLIFSRWDISSTHSASPSIEPLKCSFLVSWMKCLLDLWGCYILCLFCFTLSFFCCPFYFVLSLFVAFLEIFVSPYVPKTAQKGGRPILFSTIDGSLHRWAGVKSPVSLRPSIH